MKISLCLLLLPVLGCSLVIPFSDYESGEPGGGGSANSGGAGGAGDSGNGSGSVSRDSSGEERDPADASGGDEHEVALDGSQELAPPGDAHAQDASQEHALQDRAADSPPESACESSTVGPCTVSTLVARAGLPAGIYVSKGYLYWADRQSSALYRVKTDGSGTASVISASSDDVASPSDVVVDTQSLYWSESDPPKAWKRPLLGGAKTELLIGLSSAATFLALDLGGSKILATDWRVDSPQVGAVYAGSSGGAAFWTLYDNQTLTGGVATQSGVLYWAERAKAPSGSSALVQGTTLGDSPTVLGKVSGSVAGLACDSQALFWVADSRRIGTTSLADGQSRELYDAGTPFGTGDVAVDTSNVYWSEPMTGRIRKLQRFP